MFQVAFFSFQPWRLRRLIGIRAAIDDLGNVASKSFLDLDQARRTATILDNIMEQRGNGFCFVRAKLKCDRGYSENMRDVRDARLFSSLITVLLICIDQRLLKFLG